MVLADMILMSIGSVRVARGGAKPMSSFVYCCFAHCLSFEGSFNYGDYKIIKTTITQKAAVSRLKVGR